MLIDIAIESVQGLISYFRKYRETGFPKALEAAKEIAMEMDINPVFVAKRKIKRKRQFHEGTDDGSSVSLHCNGDLIPVVDQAIVSLIMRFEQYQGYEKLLVSCLLQRSCDPWIRRI